MANELPGYLFVEYGQFIGREAKGFRPSAKLEWNEHPEVDGDLLRILLIEQSDGLWRECSGEELVEFNERFSNFLKSLTPHKW